MDLVLHFSCAYPLIKQGFTRAKSANHLPVRGNRNLARIMSLVVILMRRTLGTAKAIFLYS